MYRLWPILLFAALFLLDTPQVGAAPTPSPLPVDQTDPSWGDADAPVTLIGFSDLECTFCNRVLPSLAALKKHYGPKKLRIVHKHFPLAFHKHADAAAEAGAAVQTLEGSAAFFNYQKEIFTVLQRGDTPLALVEALGLDVAAIEVLLATDKPKKKVAADVALGTKVGVKGTPAFFVNGVFMSGAQPKDNFAVVIDEQLAAASALQKKGIPAATISDVLTRENFAAEAGKPGATVWKLPIDKSPTMGPADALATLVLFSDFECPYCSKLMRTLNTLRGKYGADLRVVFKHNPLSFHPRADDAAELALEAHARRGDAAFWQAADKLFADPKALSPADLERIASEIQLDPKATMAAVQARKHKERIETDQLLAQDVGATGTPASYINGRKVDGAAPMARFEEMIDREIARAKQLVAGGVPRARVYEHIMKTAKGPPPPPTMTIPVVDQATPVTSTKTAKVTIQVFVDFESAFWHRSVSVLRRIEKNYAGKVRFAFRHKPLPFHQRARRAHEAAAEAFAQLGSKGFWQFHDLIVADPHSLDDTTLLAHANKIGMDVSSLTAAWGDGRHTTRIDADIQLATDRNISSVPAFLINGFYVNGAQSYVKLERVVKLALE